MDNASREITQSNYRINSLNSESMQLNQILLDNNLTIDELTTENNLLKNKLDLMTEQLSKTSTDFAKVNKNCIYSLGDILLGLIIFVYHILKSGLTLSILLV